MLAPPYFSYRFPTGTQDFTARSNRRSGFFRVHDRRGFMVGSL